MGDDRARVASVASDEARKRVVHYEQDIVVHRPIEAGMTVVSRATPVALLAAAERDVARDQDARRAPRTATLVNEQYVTEFFRGVEADESVGERAPDHRLERGGRRPLAEVGYPVAEDQTVRYAAASGDDFAIHLDDEFARAVGLPGTDRPRPLHDGVRRPGGARGGRGRRPARRAAARRALLGAALSRRHRHDPGLAR